MSPGEAYAKYQDGETLAHDLYLGYWIEKFKQAGITFTAVPYNHVEGVDFQGRKLSGYVCPRQHDGINLTIHLSLVPPNTWRHRQYVRVRSDSGFAKLIRRLHTGYYQ